MSKLLKGKRSVIVFFAMMLLLLCNLVLIPKVIVNYDMSQYLPEDSNTKIGLTILEEEFGNDATIQLMIAGVDATEVVSLKHEFLEVTYVQSVTWLDDYIDLTTVPMEYVPQALKDSFYLNQNALLTLTFDMDAYNRDIETSLEEISQIVEDYDSYLRGEAIDNQSSRNIAQDEVLHIMIWIIPIFILILILASHSWIEPLIILVTLGVGIGFNMGSNLLFDSVSFITMTIALALQLAVSLDYSLFLMHRYYEERERLSSPLLAISSAVKQALPSILTSTLTTIVGFLALLLLRYQIGADIGLVLAKGVFFSFLSVLLLMPILLLWLDSLLLKSKHRPFLPSFKRIGGFFFQARFILVPLFLVVAIGGYYFSTQMNYRYGETVNGDPTSTITIDQTIISETFGSYQPIVILVNNKTVNEEIALVQALLSNEYVESVTSLVTSVDPTIDRSLLPEMVTSAFIGEHYTRFIVNTNILEEGEEMFELNTFLRDTTAQYYEESYYLGLTTSTSDIKEIVLADTPIVLICSALAVGLVILILFKSFLIPILLVLVIQSAIWINMSIVTFQGSEIIYIGYLVIMSIQLGATIDYAVLLTNRYLEFRAVAQPKEAITKAMEKSSISILISAVILSAAGFVEGMVSKIGAVQDIGMLLGKGALISAFCVFFFLPPLLIVFDRFLPSHKKSS